MANTVIQLKFSTVTATPTTLNVAEPAYSYTSNTLFIGSPAGTGSIAIGGKFYIDQQQRIYNHANAAYEAANNAGSSSFNQAAFDTANNAFNKANASFEAANSAGSYANAAFLAANTAGGGSPGIYANGAFESSNSAGRYANSAFAVANSASIYANGAFVRANNSLSANSGGTVTGNVTIVGDFAVTGNLTISGNTITHDVETLNISDPLIYLAANNYTSDVVDIGFAANYFDGSSKHTGLIRHAADDTYYLFFNYGPEPQNNIIDVSDATFRVATLNANIVSQTVTVRGVEVLTYAQAGFGAANSAGSYANSAFAAANSATSSGTSAGLYANAAFAKANTQDAINLTQNNSITSAFTAANSAGSYANSAFAKANTDFTNIAISAADYGSATRVSAFKLEANGRISSANSTLIAIDASQITSGTLPVNRGGTGNTSLQTNAVLLGQGTSAVTTVGSSVEGHVLTINSSGVPTFEHISGGTF